MEKENPVLDKSFQFALDVIDFSELLDENRKYVLSKQLLRSGTSIGACIREAQSSESKADFIHKLKLQPRKPKRLNIGYCYVAKRPIIQKMNNCCQT